ncbi:MAG: ABC transporter substrate-binding protein, partial [Clostridia bacterium]|nr:ABC transporter substrate-binding protein [Clostridia bacterium]
MKRTVTKLIALCLTLLMTLPMLAACSAGADDAIIIGSIGPLTGTAATYGNSVKNGISIAIEEINAAGGINGIPLKLEFLDDEAMPEKAKTAFENLMDKG